MGRLGAVLRRPGRVLNSIMLSAVPDSQLRLAAGNQQISKRRKTYYRKTTYRKTTEDLCRDRVPLNADTQLGAFGPGADPKRRRAAIPPPRLAKNIEKYQKINQTSIKIQAKIHQKTSKNPSKIHQKSIPHPPKNDQKSIRNL